MDNRGRVREIWEISLCANLPGAFQVHAFERSHQRFKTLEKMLKRAGCDNVDAQRADFLESKPDDFANVTRM